MPGIRKLDDAAFIRSFQSIDRVIQNNQPLFMLVWLGSALSVLTAAVMGLSQLRGVERLLVEVSWNRWNLFRTAWASLATVVLMVLLLRM